MDKINIGLIGLGNWGKNIARNLKDLGVLSKIFDSNFSEPNLKNFESRLVCKSINDIIEDDTIHAVVISSPAKTHKDIALKALQKNKHIFVEKPFCLSVEDAYKIIEQGEKYKKKIFVGHLLHYHNGFLKLQDEIKKGLIGKIEIIKANRLNFGTIRKDESVLYDLSSHDLSMIISLINQTPKDIQVNTIFKNSKLYPDIINAILTFDNNVYAYLNADWISPYKEHRFSVLGSKGSLIFDDNQDWGKKLCFNPSVIDRKHNIIYGDNKFINLTKEEPLKKELESFISCIKNDKLPITNYMEALNVQKIMENIDKKINYD